MSCGIYKITIGDHYYFGQSVDLMNRISRHKRELLNRRHKNPYMQNCFDKYQEFSFEILLYCDEDNLDMYEQRFIDAHYEDENCMNIQRHVGFTSLGLSHTDETKAKLRDAMTHKRGVQAVLPDGSVRTWSSIRQAYKEIGCSRTALRHWLRGTSPQPGQGPRWMKKTAHLHGWVFSYID